MDQEGIVEPRFCRCCNGGCPGHGWWLTRTHTNTLFAVMLDMLVGAFAIVEAVVLGQGQHTDYHSLLQTTCVSDGLLLFWACMYTLIYSRIIQWPVWYILSTIPVATSIGYFIMAGQLYVDVGSVVAWCTLAVGALMYMAIGWYYVRQYLIDPMQLLDEAWERHVGLPINYRHTAWGQSRQRLMDFDYFHDIVKYPKVAT